MSTSSVFAVGQKKNKAKKKKNQIECKHEKFHSKSIRRLQFTNYCVKIISCELYCTTFSMAE